MSKSLQPLYQSIFRRSGYYLGVILAAGLFVGCNSPLENVIERNKKLEGTQLDEVTRFDSIHYDVRNGKFSYHYTITKSSLDTTSEDFVFACRLFQKQMEENLKVQVTLDNEEFRILHGSGCQVSFVYQDAQVNQQIAQVDFSNTTEGFLLSRQIDEWTDVVDMTYDKLINPDN